MRIEKKNRSDERRILIGMIVDSIVLGRISSKIRSKPFKSKWANIIARWCVKYWRRYERAPMRQVEGLFETWSEETKDKASIPLVEKFLSTLSDEYKELKSESNSDYVIDIAGKYFNKVHIEHLITNLESDLDSADSEKAGNRISAFNKIEIGVGAGIDVLHDTEAIKEAFTYEQEGIIKYPGALGTFFGTSLERDGFIAFMGPEKRGKSFWLEDVACRALFQRRKVAFFEAGDLSQKQVMRRLMNRFSRHPLKLKTVDYPVKIKKGKKSKILIKYEEKDFKKKLSWRKAKKACKEIMKQKVKSKNSYFKLSCHPNSTLSVDGIENILHEWERDDWVADVVVIDYADILNMDHTGIEGRDRINETWKQLRALSQKFHCLVATATQADAASYDKNLITMNNFSEDKRKAGHVTGMIGLNQTWKEKEQQLMRLNWIVRREGMSNVRKVVHVVGCLDLANPAVRSTF